MLSHIHLIGHLTSQHLGADVTRSDLLVGILQEDVAVLYYWRGSRLVVQVLSSLNIL